MSEGRQREKLLGVLRSGQLGEGKCSCLGCEKEKGEGELYPREESVTGSKSVKWMGEWLQRGGEALVD